MSTDQASGSITLDTEKIGKALASAVAPLLTAIRQDDKRTVSNVKLVMQTRPGRESISREPDSFEVEGCEVEAMVQYKTDKFNAE